jgi:hypothetical protein
MRYNIGFGEVTPCGRVRPDRSVCGRPSTSGDPCDFCLWLESEEPGNIRVDHANLSLFDPEVLSAARPQRVEQKRGRRR